MAETSVQTNETTTTGPPARRLRGHKAIATSCIASRDRPGLIASAAEDGCVCWFDMRCKDLLHTMDVAQNPISSFMLQTGSAFLVKWNENTVYVSSENEVKVFDVHMLTSWKPLESYSYNKEEINQITCNSKSSFLAAADDGGDIKVRSSIYARSVCNKTLRAAHESICSSVQFLPWRPWEVITGGLDSKLIMWDFSKGRPFKVMDLGQCFNPAFVHAIAVPEADMLDKTDKICVVARGDGVVDVINIESEFRAAKSKGSSNPKKRWSTKDQNQRTRLRLDYSSGGHTAAVSCVAFSVFGEKGRYIISGGNDKAVKVWNWSGFFKADETCNKDDFLHLNISLGRKVNWLCTTPTDSENLVVCDTSKVVKVYTVA
ncbi:putative transcription factor WD40-like family [Helianthus annuus]|nr:putative transcription factor WD40-like family [Helianthus annuus]